MKMDKPAKGNVHANFDSLYALLFCVRRPNGRDRGIQRARDRRTVE